MSTRVLSAIGRLPSPNVTAGNPLLQDNFWGDGYNYLYQVNAILAGLSASTALSPATKTQLTGEASCVRAFCYLYLCGLSCLNADHVTIRPQPQPEYWQAWLATGAVVIACLMYLRNRIRAVEIVS